MSTNRRDTMGDKRYTRRLLSYAKPYTWWFLLALLIIVVTVFIDLYQPKILGEVVDSLIAKYDGVSSAGLSLSQLRLERAPDLKRVIELGIIYFGTVIAIMVLSYAQAVILTTTGQKIIYNLRTDLFTHLGKLHIGFFNDNPIGRLVTRVTNDCETVNEMFTSVIVNVLKSFFVLFGVMISMLLYNFKLAMLTFTVIPLITICTFIFKHFTKRMYRAIRAKISELNGFVAEHVSGMKVIQLFAAEPQTLDKFSEQSEILRKSHLKQLMTFAIYSPVSFVLNIAAIGILLYFGGGMVLDGVITIGTVFVFQRYIGKFFEPIQQLAEQFNIVQSANASAERIFWLLDTKPEIEESPTPVTAKSFRGEIEFKNVWFAYRDEEWILRDVSFKVNSGERVAFVGATGAGKTTIQSLICRYYDIQKGDIFIDGINIRDLSIADLRKNIGQMLQDVFLFTGDIKSNIRLNEHGISDEHIIEAAKYVNADGFIQSLPDKYDNRVIERGAAFSAGQRQLLSFARTLAFDPSVLILDEATANIDTETELLIQDALAKLMEGRTTIIVAHRLSTIQTCDKIIVMHKGEIREQGNHQELLAKGGIYYKLYMLQYTHE